MSKILIIGGGPSGMMASIIAARNGHDVELYEKNEKLGKKLYITGKGRCNITNACDDDTFFKNIVSNPKFMYSSFYQFNNYDTMDFFKQIGLPIKVERGNRVFPSSDKSSDVITALRREMERLGVKINYNSEVEKIIVKDKQAHGLMLKGDKKLIQGDSLIVATGGLSYPTTGSTGDGYNFAKETGHRITPLYPSLVPLHLKEDYISELMGLSLKNIEVSIHAGKKLIYRDFGEMLFTHFGVSGPVILSASSYIITYLNKKEELTLSIDLKPALSKEQLDARILRDFDEFKNKQFKNSLDRLLPNKLINVTIRLSKIDPEKQINSITKEERQVLVDLLKKMTFTISGLSGYNQAVITKGGISVKDINPATMESKFIKNLYFTGEVLDLDALTGGYNLQIAWTTGYVAGSCVE